MFKRFKTQPFTDAKIFTQQIVIQVSLSQSISATVSRLLHVKVNHVGHEGTTKMLAQIKVRIKWDQKKKQRGETEKPGDVCEVEY